MQLQDTYHIEKFGALEFWEYKNMKWSTQSIYERVVIESAYSVLSEVEFHDFYLYMELRFAEDKKISQYSYKRVVIILKKIQERLDSKLKDIVEKCTMQK